MANEAPGVFIVKVTVTLPLGKMLKSVFVILSSPDPVSDTVKEFSTCPTTSKAADTSDTVKDTEMVGAESDPVPVSVTVTSFVLIVDIRNNGNDFYFKEYLSKIILTTISRDLDIFLRY